MKNSMLMDVAGHFGSLESALSEIMKGEGAAG